MNAVEVGRRVRAIRVARGLSQRDISTAGMSYAYVSRIEAGERRPSMNALRLLAERFGVSEHWLETGRQEVVVTLPLDVALELRSQIGRPLTAPEEMVAELLDAAIAKVPR